jgi:dTDP-4-amino-4,6-dideoxygalactose transaminase
MSVPFLDLKAAYDELSEELDSAVLRVVRSGRFVLGAEVEAFEQEFAEFVGTRHCVSVANGLEALTMTLRALDIGPGDEVIVPSNTFIATWLAVAEVGATPVPVEPSESSFNLDPDAISARLTSRTRAIVPVHLYGHPAAMEAILSIARRNGLAVIEDAAQAHGARLGGVRVGSFGVAAAWSFYPGKNLGGMGDGGAITTDDASLATRLRLWRNYGSPRKYVHDVRGGNSRLDEVQAAVLRVKLGRLDDWNRRRRVVAATYADGLRDVPLSLPAVSSDCEPVWHLYVVRARRREALRQGLRDRGIETLVHYPIPPHLQRAFADESQAPGSMPVAERMSGEVLSLPIGPHLREEQVKRVVDAVRAATFEMSESDHGRDAR